MQGNPLAQGLEGIQNLHTPLPEVSFFAGGDGQVVDAGGGSDHGIFDEAFGLALH